MPEKRRLGTLPISADVLRQFLLLPDGLEVVYAEWDGRRGEVLLTVEDKGRGVAEMLPAGADPENVLVHLVFKTVDTELGPRPRFERLEVQELQVGLRG